MRKTKPCVCGKPDCPLPSRRLPDLFWLRRRDIPHGYVCPALMTLSMWIERLRGRDAHWSASRQNERGEWIDTAMVLVGHGESYVRWPRRLVLWECEFWSRSRLARWLERRRVGEWPRFERDLE